MPNEKTKIRDSRKHVQQESVQLRCRDVGDWLNEIAPPQLAEKWDNVGWMAGEPDLPVTGILVCLDVGEHTLKTAVDNGLNLIISHHPPFFIPLYTVTGDTHQGRIAGISWKNNLQVFSAHTNYDQAKNGLTDQFADILELKNVIPYPVAGSIPSHARLGECKKPIAGRLFIDYVLEKLTSDEVRTIGTVPAMVRRVVIQNGAYDRELLIHLLKDQPDVFITGDVKYHDARDLEANHIFTIDAGHFSTEIFFAKNLTKKIIDRFPEIPIKTERATEVYHTYCSRI